MEAPAKASPTAGSLLVGDDTDASQRIDQAPLLNESEGMVMSGQAISSAC